ncbi:hemicentin-1 [Genypterus blacodes]|uniref:hemicentin-1 n=1 Tax=Genypterus blacodes TaxID=154954 RepID=UPI003F760B62
MSDSTSFVRLVVGFFLSVTGLHVIVACPIELDPPSVVVKYGDPVFVNCSTTSSQFFDGMGWEASSGGTGLMLVKHVIWEVDSLQQWEVSPQCYLNRQYPDQADFSQCHKRLPLVIYKFPENVTIVSSADPTGLMREGEQYTVTCVIHDIAPIASLTLRLYKGNDIIPMLTADKGIKEPLTHRSTYTFKPSRLDNGLQFRCEAEMNLGPKGNHSFFSSYYPVTVNFGPDIKCSALDLLEGETLEAQCNVTGNPFPIFSWWKAGQPVNATVPLRREDTGLYTIKAEGSVSVNRDLNVIVLYGPELNCPSNYTAVEHAPHNFTCTVQGFPQPKMTWYKDGEVEAGPPVNLKRSDAGQYLISATTNNITVLQVVDITVLYPPTEIVELEDTEVEAGSPLGLKCSSTGNPRPKYRWSYYRTANMSEESEDGVSVLHIDSAKAENMGVYTCYAWNERGNVYKTVAVTVTGANFECPIEITPHTMVVPYDEALDLATCLPSPTASPNVKEIIWKIGGTVIHNTSLFVDNKVLDWDAEPVCIATFEGLSTCTRALDFTMYKMADSVSIHSVDDSGPVDERTQYQLQCNITNIAPVERLTVLWYQGNETMKINGTLQVTGCLPHLNGCGSKMKIPVNVSSTINITVDRRHNGEEFRCEARLDLGPEGPRLPPTMNSSTVNIYVYYKPIINAEKLPKRIPLFRGYDVDLVCEAEGHPPPSIHWLFNSERMSHESGGSITANKEGIYTCNATNEAGVSLHEVEVILNEDYLPLIAGFVAVTVVIISVIFVFIYSIYYKNTKMRRYSLKNPKLKTLNGNVAHNGLDYQFPMSKLPYTRFQIARHSGASTALEQRTSNRKRPHRTAAFTKFIYLVYRLITLRSCGEMTWLLMICGLMACIGQPVSASCPVQLSPPSVVVKHGDPVSINCSTSVERPEGMGWESAYGGTGLVQGAVFLEWKVESLRDWVIEPKCFINVGDDDEYQCYEKASVTVYKLPDSVSVSQTGKQGPVLEGQSYEFKCDIVGVAPVSNVSLILYRGNKIVTTNQIEGDVKSPENVTNHITMVARREDNGAHITCAAKLNLGPFGPDLLINSSDSHELVVLYPPAFNKPGTETVDTSSDDEVVLNCAAVANPLPTYSWQGPNPTSVKMGNEATVTSRLLIPGVYNCTASNAHGSKTKQFFITQNRGTTGSRTTFAVILGVPLLVGVLIFIGYCVFGTKDGTLSCSKGGYVSGQPTSSGPLGWREPFCSNILAELPSTAKLEFSFSRLSIDGSPRKTWETALSGDGCSLLLKPSRVVVAFGEPVSVSCEATRPVRVLGWESVIGAAHTQQDLSVQWKVDSLIDWIEEPICYGVFFTAPRQCEEKLNIVLYKTPDSVSISPVNHTGPMVEGKEYQLLCEVQNIAPVQYLTLRWYRSQTEVYNHSFSELTPSSPVQVSSILLITPTKADNGVQYRCVAELELGPEGPQPPPTVTSEPLNASVYYPPSFLSPETETLDLIAGADITLNCTATGNPTPVYSWQSSHSMQESMEDEAILTSASLLPGTYTCTASNKLDKKSKQFIIKAKTKGV